MGVHSIASRLMMLGRRGPTTAGADCGAREMDCKLEFQMVHRYLKLFQRASRSASATEAIVGQESNQGSATQKQRNLTVRVHCIVRQIKVHIFSVKIINCMEIHASERCDEATNENDAFKARFSCGWHSESYMLHIHTSP